MAQCASIIKSHPKLVYGVLIAGVVSKFVNMRTNGASFTYAFLSSAETLAFVILLIVMLHRGGSRKTELAPRRPFPWMLLLMLYVAGAYYYWIMISYIPPLTALAVWIPVMAVATGASIMGWRLANRNRTPK